MMAFNWVWIGDDVPIRLLNSEALIPLNIEAERAFVRIVDAFMAFTVKQPDTMEPVTRLEILAFRALAFSVLTF